jgi:hypothetical protein
MSDFLSLAQARWKILSFFMRLIFGILTPFLSFFHTKHVTRAKQKRLCIHRFPLIKTRSVNISMRQSDPKIKNKINSETESTNV